MCFSATASFIASGSIGSIGLAGLREVKKSPQFALALIPVVFAVQQGIEGIIWVSTDSTCVTFVASKAYLFFAYTFWPVYIPWAVRLGETVKKRKDILFPFLIAGTLIGLYGLWLAFIAPEHPVLVNENLQYQIPEKYYIFGILYVLAVTIPCLISTSKWIKIFGIFLFLTFLVALIFSYQAVASVWCYYSAFASILVYFHLRAQRKKEK